jgi:hypothetical protein
MLSFEADVASKLGGISSFGARVTFQTIYGAISFKVSAHAVGRPLLQP